MGKMKEEEEELDFAEAEAKYEIMEKVGSGAYGTVCAARERSTERLFAVKKVENAFKHKAFARRTLREVKILRMLQHENIVGLHEILRPTDPVNFRDVYMVFELMETDLASIIKSDQALSNEHCQFFTYQLLRGLKYLHSCGIIHRDLKPRNLLVNSNCDLKICDFGLSRVDLGEHQRRMGRSVVNMTDYVATRWYRAPEVILSWVRYTESIDMWAAGCILAELCGRRPIFPGADSGKQIESIAKTLGRPTRDDIALVQKEKCRAFLKALPRKPTRSFKALYPDIDPWASDLLSKLIIWNPDYRLDATAALEHPYLQELHCPEDEPVGNKVQPAAFEFDNHALEVDPLRILILDEMRRYNEIDTIDLPKNVLQLTVPAVPFLELETKLDETKLEDKESESERDEGYGWGAESKKNVSSKTTMIKPNHIKGASPNNNSINRQNSLEDQTVMDALRHTETKMSEILL